MRLFRNHDSNNRDRYVSIPNCCWARLSFQTGVGFTGPHLPCSGPVNRSDKLEPYFITHFCSSADEAVDDSKFTCDEALGPHNVRKVSARFAFCCGCRMMTFTHGICCRTAVTIVAISVLTHREVPTIRGKGKLMRDLVRRGHAYALPLRTS